MNAGLGGLHRIVLIMDGRGRTGQIVDLVDLNKERKRHVVAHELEAMMLESCRRYCARAGEIIVDADDAGAVLDQALAKMRAEKAGTPGHKHAGFEMHKRKLPREIRFSRHRDAILPCGLNVSPPDQIAPSRRLVAMRLRCEIIARKP